MTLQPPLFPKKGKSGRRKLKMSLPYQKYNVLTMEFSYYTGN
jgi:hypothetical protein